MLVASSSSFAYSCCVLQAVLPDLQLLVGHSMMDADGRETLILQLTLEELQSP
jgi:hypothetical protein